MKSLLKNVLRRISKKQSSKEDNATAFYPQCCAKVDDSARMRIKMSYDQNIHIFHNFAATKDHTNGI